jgi:hypothetical protein
MALRECLKFQTDPLPELGEGVADLSFVVEVKLPDLSESGIVVLDRGVGRFEG